MSGRMNEAMIVSHSAKPDASRKSFRLNKYTICWDEFFSVRFKFLQQTAGSEGNQSKVLKTMLFVAYTSEGAGKQNFLMHYDVKKGSNYCRQIDYFWKYFS